MSGTALGKYYKTLHLGSAGLYRDTGRAKNILEKPSGINSFTWRADIDFHDNCKRAFSLGESDKTNFDENGECLSNMKKHARAGVKWSRTLEKWEKSILEKKSKKTEMCLRVGD